MVLDFSKGYKHDDNLKVGGYPLIRVFLIKGLVELETGDTVSVIFVVVSVSGVTLNTLVASVISVHIHIEGAVVVIATNIVNTNVVVVCVPITLISGGFGGTSASKSNSSNCEGGC